MIDDMEQTLKTKRRRLNILAGFGAGFLVVGGILTITLLILLWEKAMVLFVVTLVCWASGFILKSIVDGKENDLKYLKRKQIELKQKAEEDETS